MLDRTMVLDAEADLARKAALDRPPVADLRRAIREIAQRQQGFGWGATMLAAMRGPGRLSRDEFFYYGLHRPGMTRERARSYLGKKVQDPLHRACNDVRWYAACHDKALFYTILNGAGLPAPRTVAVLSPRPRRGYPWAEVSADGLAGALGGAALPLFAKPIDGMYSIGAMAIEHLSGNDVSVRSIGQMPMQALVDYMRRLAPAGYMLQAMLAPDPALADIVSAVPSLRLLVLAREAPTVLSAALKMPAASSVADNFWRNGNGLAAVEQGRVSRAIVSRGLQPPAGRPDLVGRTVPGWDRAVALALDAARLFPAIRTQSWDVALTESGPVLLEVNFGGDLNLHQLAHDRGILTDEFREHLRGCGYKGKLH